METYNVKIQGITPLMHHRMTEEELFGLLGKKEKKNKPKEVRTPRQIAETHSYKNAKGEYVIPMSYISGAFRHVASDYKQTNKASRRSIKAIAGGVFRPLQDEAILKDHKGKVLKKFEVSVMKANNHKAGAVAVCRPRFDKWQTEFEIQIDETIITPEMTLEILEDSGRRAGIGSFRVAKSGYFGQFQVTEWKKTKTKH